MSAHDKLAYRISHMVARLSMGEKLTIKGSSQDYQTSERTIRRDFERLSGVLPLEKDKDGYFLSHQHFGKFNFADVSKFADLSGTKTIYPVWDLSFFQQLLRQDNDVYQIKTHAHENAATLKQTMAIIQEAIGKQTELCFAYKDKKRTVQPYRLVYQGVWYLAGVENGRLKTYHVSRMQRLYPLATSFVADKKIAQQVQDEQGIWFVPANEKITVSLHVDTVAMPYFVQRAIFPEQQIIKQDDDGLQLTSQVSHKMQIFPLVRFWIPHIVITSPDGWQGELMDTLKTYLNTSTLSTTT